MKRLAIFGAIILSLISFGKAFATPSFDVFQLTVTISCPNSPAYTIDIHHVFSGFASIDSSGITSIDDYYGLRVVSEKKMVAKDYDDAIIFITHSDWNVKPNTPCSVMEPNNNDDVPVGDISCQFSEKDISIDDTLTFGLGYCDETCPANANNEIKVVSATVKLSDYDTDNCGAIDKIQTLITEMETVNEKVFYKIGITRDSLKLLPAYNTVPAPDQELEKTDTEIDEDAQIDEAETSTKAAKEPYFVQVPFPGNSGSGGGGGAGGGEGVVAPTDGDGCSVAHVVTPSSVLNAILMLLPAIGITINRRKK